MSTRKIRKDADESIMETTMSTTRHAETPNVTLRSKRTRRQTKVKSDSDDEVVEQSFSSNPLTRSAVKKMIKNDKSSRKTNTTTMTIDDTLESLDKTTTSPKKRTKKRKIAKVSNVNLSSTTTTTTTSDNEISNSSVVLNKTKKEKGERKKKKKSKKTNDEFINQIVNDNESSEDKEVASVSEKIAKKKYITTTTGKMIGLRRLHKRSRNSLSITDITPESSPITVPLSPHRSTKTPRKSPVNIGSPKTHSLLPERLSKTPRKLPVTLSSPITSDESPSNKSNDELLSLNTTKTRKKLSPQSKTPKIVLRKTKSTKVKKTTPKKNVTPKKLVINNKNIASDKIHDDINNIKLPQVLLRRVSSSSLLSSAKKSKPTAVSPRKRSGPISFDMNTEPTVEITDDEIVATPPKPSVTRLNRSSKNSPIAVEKPRPRKSSGSIPFNITVPTAEITDDEVVETPPKLITTKFNKSSKPSPIAVKKSSPRKSSGPIPVGKAKSSEDISLNNEVVETLSEPIVTRLSRSIKNSPAEKSTPRKSSGPIPFNTNNSTLNITDDEVVERLPEPIVTRLSRSSKNSPAAVEKLTPRKSSGQIPFNITNPTLEITNDEVEETIPTSSVTTRLSRSSKNSPITVEKSTPKKRSGSVSLNKTDPIDDEVIATPLKQITTRSSKNSPNQVENIEPNKELSNDKIEKTPLKPVITSRFHRNSKNSPKLGLLTNDDNKLTSSTPYEKNGKSQNLNSTSILSVDTFYGTSSPRASTRSNANKSIEIENESFPLISDDDDDNNNNNNNTFEISGIDSMKDNVLSSNINNKSIDKDNKDDTYELIPKVKSLKKNDTYELEEPKTPGLKKRATKRSIDNNNHDDDDEILRKKICRVRFASPSINKLNNSTINNKSIVNKNTRKATPSSKNNENKNDDKINRRSISMINLSINNKTPNSIIKKRSNSVVNDNRGKLSAVKAQNESSNRLSKPRQSLTCEKKKPDNINNNKITSSAKKIPNFAQIHQKKFSQMESLVDAKKRIELRHNALVNNNNNVTVSKNGPTVGIVKPVKKIVANDASTVNNNNGEYNKFGFKLRKTDATQAVTKEVPSTKIQAKKEDKRQILKGVRSNRRFELMMKSRNIK